MAEYYLISQLPTLDGINENMPLPITEERFLELCESLLPKKVWAEVANLTLSPDVILPKSNSALVDAWNRGERNLRLALSKVRAERMKKSFDIDMGSVAELGELIKVANEAVDSETPMEAEIFLSKYRLEFLETLRPMDNFSQDFLFYYGLKLKLLLRIRQSDTKLGEAAYKNIYNSILNGDSLEDVQ